ncbi:hypothetical protein KJ870_12340, partial [bacterium]|nr:hypothetical protein [bacterium]
IDSDAAVSDLLAAANNAADAANAAIANAEQAADTLAANPNPTSADIATAQNAIDAAETAIETAADAATSYENAATSAGEEVQATTTVGSTDTAQETLTTAVNAEIDSDAEVSDLLAAANNAAEAANTAIANAEQAADTLAANPNPTSADIATAQNAIDAAETAIETAADAATSYENAATSAGETLEATTTVGSTDDAQTTLDGIELNNEEVIVVTINSDNLADTESGFSVSAFDAFGKEASISNNQYGFGVTGNASGANAELGYKAGVGSEKLVVDFDNDVSSVDVSFGWKNSNEDAEVTFYKDGVEVGSTIHHGGSDRIDAAVTLQPDNGSAFDQVVFSAPAGGDHDYMINSISFSATQADVSITEEESADYDTAALAPTLSVSLGDAVAQVVQVVDTEAMTAQGITQGSDGNYYQTTYAETAKLMKTETVEVGKAEKIRLDDAPDNGVLEVQGSDGNWSEMAVGQEYDANVQVRFTPDSSASSATKDIKIGTFGENEGTNKFSEKADVSDWGSVAKDGKSVTFTDGELSVTTTVVENGSEQKLAAYNKAGTSDGAGIGDTDGAGLSRGETMVVKIDGQDVNQVVFKLDGLGGYFDESSSHATEVLITAYDKNGNEIDAQGGFRESGKFVDSYEFTTTVPVARFEITTQGSDGNFVVQNMTLSKTIVDDVKFTAIAEDGTELSVVSDINIQQGMGTTNVTNLLPVSDEPMTKDVKVVDIERMEAKDALLVDGTWVVESGEVQVSAPMKDEIQGYEYQVDMSAALSDTDGSESLSDMTIFGLPAGITLEGYTPNADGSYTVSLDENGEANVTMISQNALSNDDINSIKASVTSTEENGGDTSTVEVNAEVEVTGTEGDDTLNGTDSDEYIDGGAGADTIAAGAGDDTVLFDANDVSIDGGEGLDTLVFEGDINIDLGALETQITNMETLNLGEGSQNISLSLEDVVDITDAENLLRIDGDAGDTINLDTLNTGGSGEWTLGEFKTDLETGQTYQEVTGGEGDNTVTLEISTNITIEES